LFGGTTPAATGGLFGTPATPATPAPLFGSTAPAAGGLFGASASAGASTGTSLFGGGGGGSLLGSNIPAAGGSLFGATAAPAGGSLFGAPAASTAPAGGGLFGVSAAAPAAGGGLFGASSPIAGGLFGGAAPATPAAGGGLFGAAAAGAGGGLFGAAAAGAAGGIGFGATATQGQMGMQQGQQLGLPQQPILLRYGKLRQRIQAKVDGAEGYAFQKVFHILYDHVDEQRKNEIITHNRVHVAQASAMGGFGAAGGGQVAQIVVKARHDNSLTQRRQFGDNVSRTRDPRNFFEEGTYSRDPVQAYTEALRQKPVADRNEERQRELELEDLKLLTGKKLQYIEERVCNYPDAQNGPHNGLERRREQQVQRLSKQEEMLKNLRQRLEKVRDEQQKTVQLQIERMREISIEERDELIKVVARLELLKGPHQRSRNGSKEAPLTTDEENFRDKLEQMRSQLDQPGQFNSRLESLNHLQYLERRPQEVSWNAFSDEDKRRIVHFLQYQKSALQIMTADVREKERHLEVMEQFYQESGGRGGI